MNLQTEIYDVLIGANCSSLLYLCDNCESSVMKADDSAVEMHNKLQSTLHDINASLSCMAANDHQEDTRNICWRKF